ncbi:tRNA (adenosine(37)-N6)-threonylcarbamoyltransferase complex dimerization subunit type 1 TsaB [Coriobacteriia bacterium Es71-Z0120]|uniref:tRNA (adenosine(37)-N6)-threonylcarbamoyltransferase complex dimerization subunit type 1 TsaB n=1 Tax=Parvivirga hydrogeniphila TaxID=2939460 RepID=UPI002260C4A6|nr:tRNA (adenosine(37)-N6)-threonylcarbamoyltransferase complex dimerization subunit type 1 TsaB [Parvivirga hydrogeniphila]MCL4078590.1 tRNA (adenosine(37)-N6)-threonylcarbamoyltransferase complex dimerization subunit type 1 TsaB [Parvivirga hydrogeniphila]
MRAFVALDTATEQVAVGVGDVDDPSAVLAERSFAAPRAANEVLLLTVEGLLAEAGLRATDVAAVACGRGPGSFTGVRIAVATAKGMAHGLGVPLVGFGTSDAIAQRASRPGIVGVVTDAMRGEVYPALFEVGHDGRVARLTPDRVATPDEVARGWAARGERMLVTGTGLAKHREVFERVLGDAAEFADERTWVPDGASLVRAAWSSDGDGALRAVVGLSSGAAYAAAHPAVLLPVYTRLSDAEEAERRRAAASREPGSTGVAGPLEGGEAS